MLSPPRPPGTRKWRVVPMCSVKLRRSRKSAFRGGLSSARLGSARSRLRPAGAADRDGAGDVSGRCARPAMSRPPRRGPGRGPGVRARPRRGREVGGHALEPLRLPRRGAERLERAARVLERPPRGVDLVPERAALVALGLARVGLVPRGVEEHAQPRGLRLRRLERVAPRREARRVLLALALEARDVGPEPRRLVAVRGRPRVRLLELAWENRATSLRALARPRARAPERNSRAPRDRSER